MDKNIVIAGMQFGDEGKGKIVDFLSEDAEIVVRYNGGDNAGHTICAENQIYKLHLIPSGAILGKELVIGNGCVVNPKILINEINFFEKNRKKINLYLSGRAHIIMPYHIALDGMEEKARMNKIGTTKRGIGPCYMDKAERTCAVRVYDLVDEKLLMKKIKQNVYSKALVLELDNAEEYANDIFKEYKGYGELLKKYVCDTSRYLNEKMKENKKILFEGAQGCFLDVDFGTYPFTTSSNTISSALFCGCGIFPKSIEVRGIAKAYMTRVGEGYFPTELFDETKNHFLNIGKEFGTTTGRPRRCGWLDLPLLKRAIMLNAADDIVLTKLDVLAGLKKIKVCTHYEIDSKKVDMFPDNPMDLKKAKPIYHELDGFENVDFGRIKKRKDLPLNAKKYVDFIEKEIGIPIKIISIGPGRNETILC
ncbi:MAG: adenylosuccinate synthase [Candidatus Aenigmarchaeota archaeon]|nr:adenylosuccinate synthase [Candidatus Aenigmarchaeota archaeon]